MTPYTFLIQRPSGRDVAHMDTDPEPLDLLQRLVDEDLHEVPGQPGMWSTLDAQTIVERFAYVPLGAYAEDRAGVGVAVVPA